MRSFGRSVPVGEPAWRGIESVRVRPLGNGSLVEVRAPSFVWGMVRKIVAALREVDSQRLTVTRLRSALEGKVRLTLPMAEPESLVLWGVEYPLSWTIVWRGPSRGQVAKISARRREIWSRTQVLGALDHVATRVEPPD